MGFPQMPLCPWRLRSDSFLSSPPPLSLTQFPAHGFGAASRLQRGPLAAKTLARSSAKHCKDRNKWIWTSQVLDFKAMCASEAGQLLDLNRNIPHIILIIAETRSDTTTLRRSIELFVDMS